VREVKSQLWHFLKRLKTIYLLVDLKWYASLKLVNLTSQKIKVGFGPVYTDESTLGDRKFRIDPIVNAINKHSKTYVADVFTKLDKLDQFEVIVLVKNFDHINYEDLVKLKDNGKILIYDIIDNPAGCRKNFFAEPKFISLLSGMILLSPLDVSYCEKHHISFKLIECPVTNNKFVIEYDSKVPLRLIWQGYSDNGRVMKHLHAIIKKVSQETGTPLEFVYHTNLPSENKGMVRYIEWKIEDWEEILASADIGIVIKPLDDQFQQRKPSNKLITYMVAGLPTICTPCEADKLVMTHKENGFFAYTDEDWYNYLKMLVEDAHLRQKIGQKARSTVMRRNNLQKIGMEYEIFFDDLRKDASY
jgi:hypothetical protein